MNMTRHDAAPVEGGTPDRKKVWFATGGVAGAILASSCCIGPFALLSLGVSGAWVGNLTALASYQPLFVAVALVSIGLGFRSVYFQPKAVYAEGSYCARPPSAVITKTALWCAAAIVMLALTVDWWAPLLY